MDVKVILEANHIKFSGPNSANWIKFDCPTGITGSEMAYSLSADGAHGVCISCGMGKNIEQLVRDYGWIMPGQNLLVTPATIPEPSEDNFKVWSLREILQKDFGEQDWVVDKLIPAQAITMLSGDPETYKSFLALIIAASVSLGENFLDQFPVTQGVVLVIDEENHLRHLKKRLRTLDIPETAPVHYISQSGFKLDNDANLQMLAQIIERLSVKLVIFDSFVRVHASNENESGDMAKIFNRIKALTRFGTAVLIIHHHRKESAYGPRNPSQSVRGSSDITAALDCLLSVERHENEVRLSQNKLRVDVAIKPFKVALQHVGEQIRFVYSGEAPERILKKDQAKKTILEILVEGEHDRDQLIAKIRSAIQIGIGTIGDALRELESENKIGFRLGESGKKFYSLGVTE